MLSGANTRNALVAATLKADICCFFDVTEPSVSLSDDCYRTACGLGIHVCVLGIYDQSYLQIFDSMTT